MVSVLSGTKSADHKYQLALQVACFTHVMRLDGVGKLIPNDRWRPHRIGF
jgi:hypothetical protein